MDKSQYKNVYVFVEQRDGVVQNVALELLGKARELADALHEQVVALLLGKGVKDKADELIAAGADVVLSDLTFALAGGMEVDIYSCPTCGKLEL